MTIPTLPAAPSRGQAPEAFALAADAWVAAIPAWTVAANAAGVQATADAATAAAQVPLAAAQVTLATAQVALATTQANNALTYSNSAAASANFKGDWSILTGALNIPASVFYLGSLWMLSANTANVTTIVPGVSASWIALSANSPLPLFNLGVI